MADESAGFEVRGEMGEQLVCEARAYAHDPSEPGVGYDDLQWIVAHAFFRSPYASFAADLYLRTEDFLPFASGLRRALTRRGGEADFDTLERQLHFTVALDPLGRAQVDGELAQVGDGEIGSRLHFLFAAATLDVERLLHQTEETLRRFPVRGARLSGRS
jgi:hypothetical protein